jgi:hypothetical protein
MRIPLTLCAVTALFLAGCSDDSTADDDTSGGTAGGASGTTSNGGASGSGAATGGDAGASGSSPGGAGGSSASGGAAASGGAGTSGGSSGGSDVSGGTSAGGSSTGGTSAGGTAGSSAGAPAGGAPSGPIGDRLGVKDVAAAAGVKGGVRNYRIWGAEVLRVAPVFTVPLANCGTLVGYTTGSDDAPTSRVARLDVNDDLIDTLDLGAFELRGLAAEADGHFGALLWDPGAEQIFVARYDWAGAEQFMTELVNSDNHPTDFGIGESRLEYGAGEYGAYYHVHSDSGHEGDSLKYVEAASGTESTEWDWGCSHSMSNLLRFHPSEATRDGFLPVCVTDCYPGTDGDFETQSIGGVYIDNRDKVIDVDAGCNGSVAGELGGAAIGPDSWKLVFNAHQAPATLGQSSYDEDAMNQDIAFAPVSLGRDPGAVIWLTTTGDVNENDSSIARWEPADDTAEQYLVGWNAGGTHQLARVDGAGAFLEGPIMSSAAWGERDDPFRQHYNKDIVWAWFDDEGDTTFHFARVRAGGTYECAAF